MAHKKNFKAHTIRVLIFSSKHTTIWMEDGIKANDETLDFRYASFFAETAQGKARY